MENFHLHQQTYTNPVKQKSSFALHTRLLLAVALSEFPETPWFLVLAPVSTMKRGAKENTLIFSEQSNNHFVLLHQPEILFFPFISPSSYPSLPLSSPACPSLLLQPVLHWKCGFFFRPHTRPWLYNPPLRVPIAKLQKRHFQSRPYCFMEVQKKSPYPPSTFLFLLLLPLS